MQPEEMLTRSLSGDETAFVAILDLFEQPVFAYMRWRRVDRTDAEDLTQQVFLTLIQRGSSFDPAVGRLRGFIFGIARRVWLKHAAARRRAAGPLPESVMDGRLESPEGHAEMAERRAAVTRAMDALPERTREILTLRMHQNLALKEIADALRMPLNSVKSHLFRARQQLRDRIATDLQLNEDS